MRKLAFLTLFLLLIVGWAMAQTTSSSGSATTDPNQTQPAAGQSGATSSTAPGASGTVTDKSAAPTTDQTGAAQSSTPADQTGATQTTPPDQSGTTSTTGAAADQNAGAASDQSAATSDQNTDQNAKHGKLPQTASPLPFIGLLGLGSLAVGAASRKRK